MQILQARHVLTAEGWAADRQIAIGPDGRIAGIGPPAGRPDRVLDVLLPAPANLHSHAFQRAMSGLTESRGPDPADSFWTWRRLMYRFLDRLTPEQVEAIAALAFVEMLEAGYGAVAEFHYLHHGAGGVPYADRGEIAARIVAAARTAGIGLTLLPVLYRYGGCDRRPPEGGQRRFANDRDGFCLVHEASVRAVAGGHGDFGIGVAPHSLRAAGPEELAEAVALAPDGPVHIHVAEQVVEVEEVQAALGARPVEWLLEAQPVDARWCLIHCTQMTPGETRALARTGAVAGLCPITEANLGDGIFDGVRYRDAGGRFGIGTDSNVQITLFGELRMLEYGQRLRNRSRAALADAGRSSGRVLFDGAVAGGARATARGGAGIAAGSWADLIGLSVGGEATCGRSGDALLDSLIFGAGGRDCIREVWSAGRHVVTGGRHRHRDRIARAYCETVAQLERQA